MCHFELFNSSTLLNFPRKPDYNLYYNSANYSVTFDFKFSNILMFAVPLSGTLTY